MRFGSMIAKIARTSGHFLVLGHGSLDITCAESPPEALYVRGQHACHALQFLELIVQIAHLVLPASV
jgi:hypothetical protein